MNRQQKSTLADYIGWLFRKLQELNKAQEAAVTYRLINVEEIGSKQKLTIQVVGTAQTFSIAPKKILSNDAMVEHFSSKDIRTITYYATKALTQPKNKIVIKRFCERLNQIVFGVKHIDEEQINEKTATEISLDKELLNNLTAEEAHMVGYSSAYHLPDEKEILKKLRERKNHTPEK